MKTFESVNEFSDNFSLIFPVFSYKEKTKENIENNPDFHNNFLNNKK